jgi:hypothetical protein
VSRTRTRPSSDRTTTVAPARAPDPSSSRTEPRRASPDQAAFLTSRGHRSSTDKGDGGLAGPCGGSDPMAASCTGGVNGASWARCLAAWCRRSGSRSIGSRFLTPSGDREARRIRPNPVSDGELEPASPLDSPQSPRAGAPKVFVGAPREESMRSSPTGWLIPAPSAGAVQRLRVETGPGGG